MALQEFYEKYKYVIESYGRGMGHNFYTNETMIPEQTLTN